MSKVLINQYYNDLDRAIKFGKSTNETSVRNHFWKLLNDYARKRNYEVVPEVGCMGKKGRKVFPDGIVKNLFGLDIGLWESKDEKDVIDDEIEAKIKKGYPLTNILFEDTQTAILFQHNKEVMRVSVRDADKFHTIITEFISFKNETINKFEDAIDKFKADIPIIVETLRKRIIEMRDKKKEYIEASNTFLELCKSEINPDITIEDIREMMIQHILTSDIFNKIFDDPEFHRHNNIARELEKLIETLFTHNERKNLMGDIESYYDTINSAAAGIVDHHEKQKFLKVLYENFYKVYNPKAADRLGVVYTPNEIVEFMIKSTDYLLHKHFGKTLADKNVEILDPATGTGTFITSIIDHIPTQHLEYKYKNELHANEVAILPYYVANLNVEFTYKQKMGRYEEYKNLCFVDTLDNIDALDYGGRQRDMFGLTSENAERIKRQNSKKISVVIGNPPYNANQKNENENNKNREYPAIDKRIKETYIKYSTAQKTKLYDMYSRFYRWASDRLDENGILAFITNRSFIDSRTFDGFRKCVQDDFTACYIIDTKSDVRANPKIAGTTHNVFGIQTGVAIMYLVKKDKPKSKCRIEYYEMDENWRKEEKLEWLRNNKLENIPFENITPDKNNNWINLTDNDFDCLMPLDGDTALFGFNSLGVSTNRDAWVYDYEEKNLEDKLKYFIKTYNKFQKSGADNFETLIKWSNTLKNYFYSGTRLKYSASKITKSSFRPFVISYYYSEKILSDRLTSNHYSIFGDNLNKDNFVICFNSNGKDFRFLATKYLFDLHFTGDSKCIPFYRYTSAGQRIENITDWGLKQFVNHYKDKKIKKKDIFHYTYAVLHNPAYREKYKLNLRRNFPRLPFYKDFWLWAGWGKNLMNLHINFEKAKLFDLKKVNIGNGKSKKADVQTKIKVKLKANKELGEIYLDEMTTLTGVPKEAWKYKLGNRSALEWILDQYKEKKPRDATIAEKFNTYRFADYKKQVINLLKRVCTVSVETMKIIEEMKSEDRFPPARE